MRYYVSGYYIFDTVSKRSTGYGEHKHIKYASEHRRTYTGEDAIAVCEWLNERNAEYKTLHSLTL